MSNEKIYEPLTENEIKLIAKRIKERAIELDETLDQYWSNIVYEDSLLMQKVKMLDAIYPRECNKIEVQTVIDEQLERIKNYYNGQKLLEENFKSLLQFDGAQKKFIEDTLDSAKCRLKNVQSLEANAKNIMSKYICTPKSEMGDGE